MDEKIPSRLSNEAGHLIRRCHQINQGLFYEETAGHDLTPVQVSVLRFVDLHEGIGQRNLAALIGVDEATLGGVVMRLIDRKLLTRALDARDRRLKRLSVTDAGREAHTRVSPQLDGLQRRLLAPLSKEDAAELIRLLRKLVVAHESDVPVKAGTSSGRRRPVAED